MTSFVGTIFHLGMISSTLVSMFTTTGCGFTFSDICIPTLFNYNYRWRLQNIKTIDFYKCFIQTNFFLLKKKKSQIVDFVYNFYDEIVTDVRSYDILYFELYKISYGYHKTFVKNRSHGWLDKMLILQISLMLRMCIHLLTRKGLLHIRKLSRKPIMVDHILKTQPSDFITHYINHLYKTEIDRRCIVVLYIRCSRRDFSPGSCSIK